MALSEKTNMGKISVIMGVLCGGEKLGLLERAVNSVLAQTYSDLELIICDYGSAPEVISFLDAAAERDIRIKLVRDNKLTLQEKLNCCLGYADGEYIARMDDDDYSLPQRFEMQTEYLSFHKDISFVGSNVSVVCGGEEIGEYLFPEFPQARDFRFKQPYIHPALMFRREAVTSVGGYSEDKRCLLCEDYDLLMRMYAAGFRGANIQDKLLEYTVYPGIPSKRKLKHRINECVIRFRRFRDNKLLPKALPYVVKPLAVWLIPEGLLGKIKKRRMEDGK